jgi:hypothetical protein
VRVPRSLHKTLLDEELRERLEREDILMEKLPAVYMIIHEDGVQQDLEGSLARHCKYIREKHFQKEEPITSPNIVKLQGITEVGYEFTDGAECMAFFERKIGGVPILTNGTAVLSLVIVAEGEQKYDGSNKMLVFAMAGLGKLRAGGLATCETLEPKERVVVEAHMVYPWQEFIDRFLWKIRGSVMVR